MSRGPVVWAPGEAAATNSGLARYMRWLAGDAGREFASYAELWAWSVDDLDLRRDRSGRLTAPRARRGGAGPRRSPHPYGQEARDPDQADFMGADPVTTLNRGSVADPAALDAFVVWPASGRHAGRPERRPSVTVVRHGSLTRRAPARSAAPYRRPGLGARARRTGPQEESHLAPDPELAPGDREHARAAERDSVDGVEFENAAARALAARGRDRRPALERAAALWTGEPLPEDRYATWSFAWRERLVQTYGQVLSALLEGYEASGEHHHAIRAAQRLLEVDPLDERAHRRLMVAYARTGRTSYALRQYLECRRALVVELGVEPSAETSRLQARILGGGPA